MNDDAKEYLDRANEQLLMRDQILAKGNDVRLDIARREATAATILAALFVAHATANAREPHHALNIPDGYCGEAVRMADLLRAELAKVGGGS